MSDWYHLRIKVLAPNFHKDFEDAPGILSLVESLGDYGSPVKFGFYDPIRTSYTREAALEDWDRSFAWTRMDRKRRQKCEGQLFSTTPSKLGGLVIRVTCTKPIDFPAVEFLEKFNESYEMTLGTVHLTAAEEEDQSRFSYHDVIYPMRLGFATHDIRKHIPQLTWGTFFGPPYLKLIGRDRLLAADAAHRIRDSGERGVLIQATPDFNDAYTDFERFDAVRQQLKAQIGWEYFQPLPGEPERQPQAPDFGLIDPGPNPLLKAIEEANARARRGADS